jgi:hypothetical protein
MLEVKFGVRIPCWVEHAMLVTYMLRKVRSCAYKVSLVSTTQQCRRPTAYPGTTCCDNSAAHALKVAVPFEITFQGNDAFRSAHQCLADSVLTSHSFTDYVCFQFPNHNGVWGTMQIHLACTAAAAAAASTCQYLPVAAAHLCVICSSTQLPAISVPPYAPEATAAAAAAAAAARTAAALWVQHPRSSELWHGHHSHTATEA